MNLWKTILAAAAAAPLISSAQQVEAVEIHIERGNATSKLIVTGPIEPGDAEQFKAFWNENAYDSWHFVVALDSPGGSLKDGIEIGRFVREVGARTEVQRYSASVSGRYPDELPGAECYSACALAFMGGVERRIPEGATIGFHQFYGGVGLSSTDTMELTQHTSALIAGYLRDMGAKPALFEIMSGTSPDKMFIPTRPEFTSLNIVPIVGFHEFRLVPKSGLIVATATDERNPGPLERVYEIETLCWKTFPIMNLYATAAERGLNRQEVLPSRGYMDGFSIETAFGTFEYGSDRLRLYPETRLLASLILDANVARAIGSGNATVRLNSFTASGVLMTGQITAPLGGDQAILASFRDCL